MSDKPKTGTDEGSDMDRLQERAARLRAASPREMLLLAEEIVRVASERFRFEGRPEIARMAHKARGPVVQAAWAEMQERQEGLVFDCVNRFPDGTVDASTYGDVEDALDRAEAPAMAADHWLTLPQRIEALVLVHRLAGAGKAPPADG